MANQPLSRITPAKALRLFQLRGVMQYADRESSVETARSKGCAYSDLLVRSTHLGQQQSFFELLRPIDSCQCQPPNHRGSAQRQGTYPIHTQSLLSCYSQRCLVASGDDVPHSNCVTGHRSSAVLGLKLNIWPPIPLISKTVGIVFGTTNRGIPRTMG